MALEELYDHDDNEYQLEDGMEEDDIDYEDEDCEQFGEEDSESPPDQRKLIKVVTNRKTQDNQPSSWDFAQDFS